MRFIHVLQMENLGLRETAYQIKFVFFLSQFFLNFFPSHSKTRPIPMYWVTGLLCYWVTVLLCYWSTGALGYWGMGYWYILLSSFSITPMSSFCRVYKYNFYFLSQNCYFVDLLILKFYS